MSGKSTYSDVYQVLDEVCFRGISPAGARGSIFNAIDCLRRSSAPPDHVEIVERISIALHRLEWATLRKDEKEAESVREELQALGAQWQQTPIPMALN